MSDYGTMQTRIANEVRRNSLSAEIREAIQTAIKHYERKPFFFNEARASANTVAGQPYYPLPNNFMYTVGVHSLEITVSNNTYPITLRTWDWLQYADPGSDTLRGIPTDWGYFGEQFRLYPTPDAIYPLTLAYIKTLSALSSDNSSNAWMTYGENLIRSHAKYLLYANVIHDPEKAALQLSIAKEALQSLEDASSRKLVSGRLAASYL